MTQDFQTAFSLSISLPQALFNLGVAFVVGLLVSLFYRWTYRGTDYSSTFVISLIAMAMITAIVIMVIGNNLARAFGLVGAMSIIRFRTAIKNTQDIVFIFFSLAVGMAAGVGLHTVSVAGTLLVGGILLILFKSNYAVQYKNNFLLQLVVSEATEEGAYLPVLGRFCRDHRLVNTRASGDLSRMEISYYVQLKKPAEGKSFIQSLKRLDGVDQVNLYFDEEAL